jgi:hypothetical protein
VRSRQPLRSGAGESGARARPWRARARARRPRVNGMPASLILRFARVSRRFIVSGSTRKARAISSVVSPPSARSVRATCASSASAGWQHTKISSSRSSGKSVSSTSCSSASGRSSSLVFSARVRSRRMRSSARRRAVVVSQAPGLSGVPSARPALRRDRESPLGCLLGEVEVAKVADEGRQDALPAAARRQPLLRATMQTAVARIRVTFTSVAAHDGRT